MSFQRTTAQALKQAVRATATRSVAKRSYSLLARQGVAPMAARLGVSGIDVCGGGGGWNCGEDTTWKPDVLAWRARRGHVILIRWREA